HHIECGERRDRSANADREDEERGRCKSRRRTHRPERVPHILVETIEPHETPGFARVLAQSQRIAERHTAALLRHLAVKRHLVRQLVVEAAAIEQIVDAAQEFSHVQLSSFFPRYAVRRIAWMALVSRSYWAASASSCFTPSRVIL